jgi:membrane associated rhomboid family serine protease
VRFARAVLTRPATFTFVFVTFNVFIFLLMCIKGGGIAATEDPNVLLLFGAKFNSLINQGEWWRLITPVFMHIGVLHLLVNMYSLFMLGPYVERLYGSARYVFFWVATGVAGVAASYFASSIGGKPGVLGRFLFRGGDGPSAGASGALFGLVGVLFVFGIKYRHELPDGFKRAFGLGMLPTILINLFIGYTIPFIDNAAHLGGLAAGMLFALFLDYKRPGERGSVAVTWHALQIAALVLVVAGFGEVARHFDTGRQSPDRMTATGQADGDDESIKVYLSAVNGGQQAFAQSLDDDASKLGEAIAALDSAPRLDDKAGRLLDELKDLLRRAGDYAGLDQKARVSARGQKQFDELVAGLLAWRKDFQEWVRTEGNARYGIALRVESAPEGNRSVDVPVSPATRMKDANRK